MRTPTTLIGHPIKVYPSQYLLHPVHPSQYLLYPVHTSQYLLLPVHTSQYLLHPVHTSMYLLHPVHTSLYFLGCVFFMQMQCYHYYHYSCFGFRCIMFVLIYFPHRGSGWIIGVGWFFR